MVASVCMPPRGGVSRGLPPPESAPSVMLLIPPPDATQPPGLYWSQTGECLLFGETSAEARVVVGAMRLPLDDAGVARLPVALPPGERLALVSPGRASVPFMLCALSAVSGHESGGAYARMTNLKGGEASAVKPSADKNSTLETSTGEMPCIAH